MKYVPVHFFTKGGGSRNHFLENNLASVDIHVFNLQNTVKKSNTIPNLTAERLEVMLIIIIPDIVHKQCKV